MYFGHVCCDCLIANEKNSPHLLQGCLVKLTMCFHSAEPCSLWQRAKKAELKWWCHELNTEVVLKLTVIPSALYCQHCHLRLRDPETQRKTKTNFSQGQRSLRMQIVNVITLNNLITTQNIAIIPSHWFVKLHAIILENTYLLSCWESEEKFHVTFISAY